MTPSPGFDDSGQRPFAPSSVMPDVDLDANAPTVGNRLATGLRLDEYEVSGVLGEGGFGIVYLAWDHALQRRVVIKEYMPTSLAWRVHGLQVDVKSPEHRASFDAGLRSFVNEAKLLAMFDHPSLLKVHRFWQANGTAYMAMPFYEGVTLKQALADSNRPPDEAWLRQLLAPLLAALEYLHEASCYHRDIAPDNILLVDDGKPLLLDFGAARQVIGDLNKAITVILKPGYAPIEQYGETPGLGQGPWTDLYALGAVLHYAMTGAVPRVSVTRVLQDDYQPLVQRLAGRYSERLLRTVDHMLRVRPEDRPRSVAEVRRAMGLDVAEETTGMTVPPRMAPDAEPWTRPRQRLPQGPGAAAAAAVLAALEGRAAPAAPARAAAPRPMPPIPANAGPRRARPAWAPLAGAGAALAAVLGGAWYFTAPVPRVDQPPVSAPASAPAPAAAPAPGSASTPAVAEPVTPAASALGAAPAAASSPAAPPAAAAAAAMPPAASAGTTAATTAAEAASAPASRPTVPAPRPVPRREALGAPAGAAAPVTPAVAPKISDSARCAEIIQRVSIGEPLTTTDRRILKEECGR